MKKDRKERGNVPNLRFPEFHGEWEETEIKNILKIGNGRDYKHLERGNIPVLGTGGYMTSVNDFLYDGESVCIGRKGTINKPFYLTGKFWTVDTLFYTYSYKNILPKFLFYIFEQINWIKYNEASGVPSLSKNTIEKIPIVIPKKEEQNKIATFLSLIDERIETQNKIIEKLKSLIKGLDNLLFCDRKSKPALRFPEYLESWRKSTLKEFASRVTRKNKDNETQRALTIAAQYGLVDQMSFFNKQVASNDMSNYYLLYNSEFAYNKSYSKDYPWGAVKRLDLYEKGALSTLYICFKPVSNINSDYLVHYFESNKWHQAISEIAGEGARNHGLLNIPIDSYFNTMHYLPSSEEQKKIASFLTKIDHKIQTEKAILEQLERQKKYLLEQMFV